MLLLNWLGAPHLLFRMPGQQLIPCRNQEHFTPNARIDHGCRVAPDFLSPTQPVFASKPLDGTSSPGLPKSRVRNANAGVMFHTVTTNTTQVFVGRGKYIYIRLGATQLQAVVVPGGLATLGWAILLSQTQVDNATKSPLKHSASTALSIVQEQP